jgi:hypothetical protein
LSHPPVHRQRAAGFLEKPFTPTGLAGKLAALLPPRAPKS